ncbi:MAG: hypothetical protein M1814_003357 [Vezdaea aestivalis]|nr:MAG: hypothetical protein M1814_003357 [Vezdaea aestivalis]
MSLQTPRRLARPSNASTPNLAAAYSSQNQNQQNKQLPQPGHLTPSSVILARKASLNQLTSNSLATIPDASVGYGLSPVQDESVAADMNPTTPAARRTNGGGDDAIELGDLVDVPGGMHGTVRFIGSVKGKSGTFAGVELSREYAPRGKNDGDVDGQANPAAKRASPTISTGSFPPTPTTPSLGSYNVNGHAEPGNPSAYTPPTPSLPKFSQSVGPGRAPSPQFKAKRPSLPRPESPLRRNQNLLATPGGRPSIGGAGTGRKYAPSPTPGKFGTSLRGRGESTGPSGIGDPGKKLAFNPKGSVNGLGKTPISKKRQTGESIDQDATPIGIARTSDGSATNFSSKSTRSGRKSGPTEDEHTKLKSQLDERDKQLSEQASSLAEMERSLTELQSLYGSDGGAKASRGSSLDDENPITLKALLREKNERIAMLTAEFDAHRADFRSTIDTLEMASNETERVYEKRVEDLLEEVRELQGRGEDVESVAQQLKQLENLVQELEEGLEDARRGEADARGEAEFLRGEVERSRSELRREREKAAAALKGATGAMDDPSIQHGVKEVEQRDDEIRGLKAIIHSLSRDAVPDLGMSGTDTKRSSQGTARNSRTNAPARNSAQLEEERQARAKLERNVKELEGLVERKSYREEELEREIDTLRKTSIPGQRVSASSNSLSDKTIKRSSGRDSKGTVVSWRDNPHPGDNLRHGPLETMQETSDAYSSDADGSVLWCEICETSGHDILTCTNMFGNAQSQGQPATSAPAKAPSPNPQRTGREVVMEGLKGLSVPSPYDGDKVAPLSPGKKSPVPSPVANGPKSPGHPMPNPNDTGLIPGKLSGTVNAAFWCAICERDGHESIDCPYEDAF